MRVSSQMQYQSKTQMEESKVYKEFMKNAAKARTGKGDGKNNDVQDEAVPLGENLTITKDEEKMIVSQRGEDNKNVLLKEYDIKSEIGKQLSDLYNKKTYTSQVKDTSSNEISQLNSSIKTMSLANYL